MKAGETHPCDQVFDWIRQQQNHVEGITISGGEPFLQPHALSYLLNRVRFETALSSIVFTGFTWKAIREDSQFTPLFQLIDVLIAGPYRHSERTATGLTGSTNKTFHFFTNRYTHKDFVATPSAEIVLGPDGNIQFSGIDPLQW